MAYKRKQVDPNKYSANKNIKPESKLSVLMSLLGMALMLTGIIGIAMEFFREDSWLKLQIGRMLQSSIGIMSIPLILLALWLLNRWITSPNKSEMKQGGNLPMYAMMAIGAYYVYKLITTGSL